MPEEKKELEAQIGSLKKKKDQQQMIRFLFLEMRIIFIQSCINSESKSPNF